MATLVQLQAEPWWSREIVTDQLSWLGRELCRRTGRPSSAWGDKGNEKHLSGGHRSQEWLRNSDYCTNRSYTVQSGLSAEELRHICAGDFTPSSWGTSENRKLMVMHTQNLFAAAIAGELTGLRQIFGTLDGVKPIGLNVLTGTTTFPDDTHLDHLHLTFDRRYMRDAGLMSRIADLIGDAVPTEGERNVGYMIQNALVGVQEPEFDIPAESGYPALHLANPFGVIVHALFAGTNANIPAFANRPARTWINATARDLAEIKAALAELTIPPVEIDYAQLAEALRPIVAEESEAAIRRVLGSLDGATP
jgi:hypothetical protein